MLPVVSTRHLRWIEYAYAALMMFALTQGPVYRLWSRSAEYAVFSPRISVAHIYFATFVVAQLPALLILVRAISARTFRNRALQVLIALHAWLGLSVVWSVFARHSLPEFIALSLSSAAGLYLAARFRNEEIWWIFLASMSAGLLLSLLAISQQWNLSIDETERYWIGIYYNRNSLAPVAGLALLASVGVLFDSRSRSGLRKNLAISIAVAAGVTALIILWRAESRTAPLALLVALGALILWRVLRTAWFGQRRVIRLLGTARLSVGVVAVAVFVVLKNSASISGLPSETATFSSRAALWSQNWTGFLEKPFFGWGWLAARHSNSFFRLGIWWVAEPTEWSHSGYYDLILGAGVLAGVLFIILVFSAITAFDEPGREGLTIRFLSVGFVLTAATQESFFIGSHFLWVVLIWALLAGIQPIAQTSSSNK
jgi:hypothetical protein